MLFVIFVSINYQCKRDKNKNTHRVGFLGSKCTNKDKAREKKRGVASRSQVKMDDEKSIMMQKVAQLFLGVNNN